MVYKFKCFIYCHCISNWGDHSWQTYQFHLPSQTYFYNDKIKRGWSIRKFRILQWAKNHGIFQRSFEINKNIPGLGPQKKYSSRATSAAEKACLSRMTPNWRMRKWNIELAYWRANFFWQGLLSYGVLSWTYDTKNQTNNELQFFLIWNQCFTLERAPWKSVIWLPRRFPNLLRISLCHESYFMFTLDWTYDRETGFGNYLEQNIYELWRVWRKSKS